MDNPLPTDLLVRKLESIHSLDEDDRAALRNLPSADQRYQGWAGHRSRGRPTLAVMLSDERNGYWYKTTGTGKRQILSFQVPGDLPDMQSIHLTTLDSSLATLNPCRLAFVQHEPLRRICQTPPQRRQRLLAHDPH